MDETLTSVTWRSKPDPKAPCAYAVEFAAFCEACISRLDTTPPGQLPEALLYLKAELFDRYCDFLTDTPVNHTNAAGKRTHRCIDDVFHDAARQVRRRVRALPLPDTLVPPSLRTSEALENTTKLHELIAAEMREQ